MNKSTKLLLAGWAVAVLTVSSNASAQTTAGSGGTMMGQGGAGSCAPRSGKNTHQSQGGGMNMQNKHAQMRAGHMASGQDGMHGSGAGNPGVMGTGQMGGGRHMGGGMRVTPIRHLSIDDVSHFFGHHLERHGNKRLRLGDVSQKDENTIAAKIVTLDGSLVQAFEVDLHSGLAKKVD